MTYQVPRVGAGWLVLVERKLSSALRMSAVSATSTLLLEGGSDQLINWGSLPDWLAGIGSTLALVFAFLAVRSANAQLRMIENDRRQSQAQGVGVWLSRDKEGAHYYNLTNTSQLPVHSVVVWVRRIGDEEQKETMRQLQWLAPGTIQVPVDHPDWIREHSLFVGIMFRDSAMRHWRRDRTGQLVGVSQDEFLRYSTQLKAVNHSRVRSRHANDE